MSSEENQLIAAKDLVTTVLYKLRLNKLDKTSRILQKNHIIDNNGFLTVEGSQVFLDALWQNSPDIQKKIAAELEKMCCREKCCFKKDCKDCDKCK